uniref:Uncharacterized protein n=1 Tax=Ananas comosus var. bracteatus TaxID=296719 RepID=A0A6V7QGV7_ANACO|nr:unnamed protein product [Ananas comosus var. bracteatus]
MLSEARSLPCFQLVFDVATFESSIGSVKLDLEYLEYLENKFYYFRYHLPSDRMGSKSTNFNGRSEPFREKEKEKKEKERRGTYLEALEHHLLPHFSPLVAWSLRLELCGGSSFNPT